MLSMIAKFCHCSPFRPAARGAAQFRAQIRLDLCIEPRELGLGLRRRIVSWRLQ
jgi:hypothetical protein